MRKKLAVALTVAALFIAALLVAQANYSGWKDVGGALVTFNKLCLESSAGAGQDFCFARTAAGHIQFQTGTGAVGTDIQGTCTAVSATTCTVTFATAYTAAPVCMVTDQTTQTNGALKALPSTTTLVITTPASSSDVFSYVCFGK